MKENQSPITNYQLPIVNYQSQISDYASYATFRQNFVGAGLASEFSVCRQIINKTRTAVAHGEPLRCGGFPRCSKWRGNPLFARCLPYQTPGLCLDN